MPTPPSRITTVVTNRKDLININGIAIDRQDNLYITDRGAHIIKVAREGTISRVAGTGISGFSGDEGQATEAQISSPLGIAFDSQGNLYFADFTMNHIRMIDAGGKISTYAGLKETTGVKDTIEQFYGGFGGDADNRLKGRLNFPLSIAFDSKDNLYIADTNNHRIRRVDKQTNAISTFAGKETAGFSGDGGLATQAELFHPACIAFDSKDNLYITDTRNHCIRKVDVDGKISRVVGGDRVAGQDNSGFAGDGSPALSAKLKEPWGIAIDGNDVLYIADTGNNRIRMVGRDGTISTIAGNGTPKAEGDYLQAPAAAIGRPTRIALDSGGNLYIADTFNNQIRKVELPAFAVPAHNRYEFGPAPFSVMAVVTPRTVKEILPKGAQGKYPRRTVITTGNIVSRNFTHHANLSAGWQLSIVPGATPDQCLISFSVQNVGSRCEVLAPLQNQYIDKPWQTGTWEIQSSKDVHKELSHIITAVRDERGECKLYLDGNLVGQTSSRSPINVNAGNTPLNIGKLFPAPPSDEYGGIVRKVALWNMALKQKDIIQYINAILDPDKKDIKISKNLNCMGFWELNGTGRDTVLDLSWIKNNIPTDQGVTSESLPMVLPFYTEYQHTDSWCWAGVAVSIENFYNPLSIVEQCSLVTDVMRDPVLKTKIPLKSTNPDVKYTLPEGGSCCDAKDSYKFWFYLDDALRKLNVLAGMQTSLTFEAYKEQIRKWRPVGARIQYQNSTNGHFLILIGYFSKQSDVVVIDDPYYGISLISFSDLIGGRFMYENANVTHFYLTQPQS
jgi:sugar lactone lactonase YvrE